MYNVVDNLHLKSQSEVTKKQDNLVVLVINLNCIIEL